MLPWVEQIFKALHGFREPDLRLGEMRQRMEIVWSGREYSVANFGGKSGGKLDENFVQYIR